MDEWGARRLLATVIEKAVSDRRQAIAQDLIDERAAPSRRLTPIQAEKVMYLEFFFSKGGLEIVLDVAGIEIPPKKIKEKSCE